MRMRLGLLALILSAAGAAAAENELTEAEKADGYQLVFDGKDLKAFQEDPKRQFHKWHVDDGVITLTRATFPKDPNFTPYPLWTTREFRNYILKVDFHTGPDAENGHSSVILRPAGKPGIYPQPGVEVSIYGPARKLGHFCTGAFRYQIQAPTKTMMKPAGEWNQMVASMIDNRATVEINGVVVNQLDLNAWTQKGKRPDGSTFPLPIALKDLPAKGPIGFRDDYGIPVWYKNIKIKPLN